MINKQYICSKYTAIAVIIKAATLIGCNMAAQNRLLSNSVGNINEMILKYTNKCIALIEDAGVCVGCRFDWIEYDEKREGSSGVDVEEYLDYLRGYL